MMDGKEKIETVEELIARLKSDYATIGIETRGHISWFPSRVARGFRLVPILERLAAGELYRPVFRCRRGS